MDKSSFDTDLKSLENFILNSAPDISYANFIVAILISAFLALVIKFTYIKISRTLNDREYFSDTFVPLAIVTTLVITVIKFSLALSLGLVGALSIVRFRAAIKEPKELVYLFLIIGIGLANGANQFLVSIICTFFIIIILFAKKYYDDKKNNQNLSDSSINVMQIEIKDSKYIREKINSVNFNFRNQKISKYVQSFILLSEMGHH